MPLKDKTAPPERGTGPTDLRGLTLTYTHIKVCFCRRETPQSLRDSSPFRRSSMDDGRIMDMHFYFLAGDCGRSFHPSVSM